MFKAKYMSWLLGLFLVSTAWADKPSYTCYRIPADKPLTIDGKLDDWPNLPILLLGQSDQVCSGSWRGPSDSMARVRLCWDDQNLYIAVEVTDDAIMQKTSRDKAASIFKMDSLQWAVDLRRNGSTSYGEGIFEYGFGVADGQPVAYRWHSSGGWPNGIAEHIQLAVSRSSSGGMIYEAAVDHSMVKPLKAAKDRIIGFNIVLQDQDGQDHKTLQWTSGIANGKNPSEFGTIVFSDAQPSSVDGAAGMLISANPRVGIEGLDVRVMINDTLKRQAIDYQLTDEQGRTILGHGQLKSADDSGNVLAGRVPTQLLKPGRYVLHITDEKTSLKGTLSFERSDVESTAQALPRLDQEIQQLAMQVKDCENKPVELAYARSVLTTAKIFAPYIQEDLKAGQYDLVEHNVQSLRHAIANVSNQLQQWAATSQGTPELLRLPVVDYSKYKCVGKHLMVDDQPVMLIGQMSWVWQLNKNIQNIADLGFNTFRIGFLGQDHFDAKGQLKPLEDQPWPAIRQMQRQGVANRMAVGMEMFCPDQVYKGISRRGPMSLGEFHKEYEAFVVGEIKHLGKGRVKDQTIEIEAQRAHYAAYDHKYHALKWQHYLLNTHHEIARLNELYGTSYASFDQVPFPEKLPENQAQRYDYARFRQIMVSLELTRAADLIRQADPGTLVQGYPYSHMVLEPGSYYQHFVDPELDTENYDIVGCDASGPYSDQRYAMATVNWLAGYYDLMRGIAGDRPLWDGEYHYANRRRIYPQNWSRAILFQSYIHGLSGTYAWVWVRSGTVDCAIHLDANVMLQSGQAALELRRTSKAIAAFHDQKNDALILYANASTPYVRQAGKRIMLSQTEQTKLVYEGIFFEGLNTGFITETQIQQGQLKDHKLLIVPNSSHVDQATRDAIEAFTQAGGSVVLIGDSLTHTRHGAALNPLSNLPSVTRLPGFADADQARVAMLPILKQADVLPSVRLQIDNGNAYPTVEWRRAVDDQGRTLLFVLNLGYEPAAITLPESLSNMVDQLDGQHYSKSFELGSLQFKLLRQ